MTPSWMSPFSPRFCYPAALLRCTPRARRVLGGLERSVGKVTLWLILCRNALGQSVTHSLKGYPNSRYESTLIVAVLKRERAQQCYEIPGRNVTCNNLLSFVATKRTQHRKPPQPELRVQLPGLLYHVAVGGHLSDGISLSQTPHWRQAEPVKCRVVSLHASSDPFLAYIHSAGVVSDRPGVPCYSTGKHHPIVIYTCGFELSGGRVMGPVVRSRAQPGVRNRTGG